MAHCWSRLSVPYREKIWDYIKDASRVQSHKHSYTIGKINGGKVINKKKVFCLLFIQRNNDKHPQKRRQMHTHIQKLMSALTIIIDS